MSDKRRRKHKHVIISAFAINNSVTGEGIKVRAVGWDGYGRSTLNEERFVPLSDLIAMAFPEGIPKEGDYVEEIAD